MSPPLYALCAFCALVLDVVDVVDVVDVDTRERRGGLNIIEIVPTSVFVEPLSLSPSLPPPPLPILPPPNPYSPYSPSSLLPSPIFLIPFPPSSPCNESSPDPDTHRLTTAVLLRLARRPLTINRPFRLIYFAGRP